MLASWSAGLLLGQAHVVYTLLFEYTPALLLIGGFVRECGRSTCSGEVAHKLLHYCYVIVTHLLYEFRYNIAYLRTIGTTLVVWDKWYDNLPRRCHVVGSCEHCWQRLLVPCAPIPNASGWAVHVICSSFR